MPVEIKELHLKFNIDGSGSSSENGSASNQDSNSSSNSGNTVKITPRLIQDCVDEVLRVMESKGEER